MSIDIDCYCDYDPPTFLEQRLVKKARKQHKCAECSGYVAVGEPYEYTAGLWDGHFDIFHICERCYNIRTWVKNNVPCFCYAFGNLNDDCIEAVDWAYKRASKEVVGLRFGLLRRFTQRDRFNMARRQ